MFLICVVLFNLLLFRFYTYRHCVSCILSTYYYTQTRSWSCCWHDNVHSTICMVL